MNHTPGPWNENGIYTILRYADKHDMDIDESEKVMPYSTDDARLIAAAPEMLEALIDAYKIIRRHENPDLPGSAELRAIKSIIERATGRKIEEVIND